MESNKKQKTIKLSESEIKDLITLAQFEANNWMIKSCKEKEEIKREVMRDICFEYEAIVSKLKEAI